MMIVSDLWRFAAVASLAALDFSGRLDFASLIVLATIVGLGDGFFYPAVGGIVPLVVDAAQLPSANSLMGVARWSSVLAGPSLAASSTTAPAPPGCSRSTRSRSWPRQP
jgi:MFS family permease